MVRLVWSVSLLSMCAAYTVGMISAPAAKYPERPVHLILGAAPGGGTDLLAQLFAQKLSEKWGQPVLVENRPGADTTIASDVVAHAAPDGYTIMITNSNLVITPALPQYKALNYDPIKSFEPIISIGGFPDVLMVNPSFIPVNSVRELVAYAKARPGKVNYSSAGPGSSPYVSMETIARREGIQFVNVTYKGSGPSTLALLGGETPISIGGVGSAFDQIKSGKIKALAVSTGKRTPVLPDVPTMEEALGFKDFDLSSWYGFFAPAGTPKDIVRQLHDDLDESPKSQDLQAHVNGDGFIWNMMDTKSFRKFLTKDIVKWGDLIRQIHG